MDSISGKVPLYGRNAVAELLKSGAAVDTVLLSETMDAKMAGYYTALARQAGAVVKRTLPARLTSLCGSEHHQGVAAFAGEISYASLEDLLAMDTGKPPFFLLADGVEDPHNLGALLRTAMLCGVQGVVIPKRGAVPVTPTVVKASAGAATHIPVARVANIGEAIRRMKRANIFVYCADLGGETPFAQNLRGAIALVVGAEGRGVAPLVRRLCDGALSLPMAAGVFGVDSFNVSVAGGIMMYEIFRQREAGAKTAE